MLTERSSVHNENGMSAKALNQQRLTNTTYQVRIGAALNAM
jgi:hypothetical protein